MSGAAEAASSTPPAGPVRVTPWLLISSADFPPPDCTASLLLGAADVPAEGRDECGLELEEVARGPLRDAPSVLAVRPALVLAAAALLVRESELSLLAALELLVCHGGRDVLSLSPAAVRGLLRLELSLRGGAASDLTQLAGAPKAWTWCCWPAGEGRLSVVCRGHVLHACRIRPEPRMAHLTNFLSAAECAHIIELGRSGGALHPSRVVNHAVEGDTGVRSDARTSESCRVSANADNVVKRAVQRAAFLSGLTPQHAEAVQVVHYEPGQQYRPHYDYLNPEDARYEEKTAAMGNRLLSVFV
jgi:hypothetical protein